MKQSVATNSFELPLHGLINNLINKLINKYFHKRNSFPLSLAYNVLIFKKLLYIY